MKLHHQSSEEDLNFTSTLKPVGQIFVEASVRKRSGRLRLCNAQNLQAGFQFFSFVGFYSVKRVSHGKLSAVQWTMMEVFCV